MSLLTLFSSTPFYTHFTISGGACRLLCSGIAWISPLKHCFPFPGAAGWVPVYSISSLFFQQPRLLWELGWRRQSSLSLFPKSRKSEHINLGNIYRSFSRKHQCQTLTVLFACFTFVLLSKQVNFKWNVFILGKEKKKRKKAKQSSSLWGVIFSFTSLKWLIEFWFLLSRNPLAFDLAVLFILA